MRQTIDEAFLKRWQRLWKQSEMGHLFNTPDWFLASCEVYSIKEFSIITVEENKRLTLVLPLVKKRMYGISVWTSLGGKFVNKSSLLVKEVNKTLLQELIRYLQIRGDFYLPEVSSDIAEIMCNNNTKLIKKEASTNQYISISPDPFRSLSSKNKSQIRAILRKNEDAITFKTFTGDLDALETVFGIDMRSSKMQQGKATYVTKQDKQFYRELLKKVPQNIIIDIVYYHNIPIVYGVGFVYKRIFHASTTAYDPNYRHLRPGKLLAQFRLKQLQYENFESMDFGRGNSELKQEFTKLSKIQYDVFFVQSVFSRRWIAAMQKIYNRILVTKRIYAVYLIFKKYFLVH